MGGTTPKPTPAIIQSTVAKSVAPTRQFIATDDMDTMEPLGGADTEGGVIMDTPPTATTFRTIKSW